MVAAMPSWLFMFLVVHVFLLIFYKWIPVGIAIWALASEYYVRRAICDSHTFFFAVHLFYLSKTSLERQAIFSCITTIALPILGVGRFKGHQSRGTTNPLQAVVLVWRETPIIRFFETAKVSRFPPKSASDINYRQLRSPLRHVDERFRCSAWCRSDYVRGVLYSRESAQHYEEDACCREVHTSEKSGRATSQSHTYRPTMPS